MIDDRWLKWLGPLRPRFRGLGLLLAGFLLGALIVSAKSCLDAAAPANPESTAGAGDAEGAETIWTCAMHPQIRQPEPGPCPICGMDLISVSSGGASGGGSTTRVVLSDRAKTLIKLRTAPVRRQVNAMAEVRLLGRAEPNETTQKTITAWTGGRIDRLHVNVTGQRVRAGQVIATLYSPEVFAAHQDLLVAKQQVGQVASSPESSRRAAQAALAAARERLRLLGVPDNELVRMETESRPTRAVAIRTPFGGTVIERLASEGAYVTTGAPLYKIADLNTLWVQLDAYENDLPRLSVGQTARIEIEAMPGEDFEGRVTFIDPTLDVRRRTARVRVEVDSHDGRLRPGMFVQATVVNAAGADERAPLVVPSAAPLFTGRRAIVYVEVETDGRMGYEPRTVRLGTRLGNFYPVVAGLSEGERVVTRGAFALDADLQIRGGASMMTSPDDTETGVWDATIDLPAAGRAQLAPIVSQYLEVQQALADDELPHAQAAAGQLEVEIAAVHLEQPLEAAAAFAQVVQPLRGHAGHVARAPDLEGARTGFEGLSEGVAALLRLFGNPLDVPLKEAFCPMAHGSQGASWIQQGAHIHNSYFGAAMSSCGEFRQTVAPGTFLGAAAADAPPALSTPAGGRQH